MKNHIPILCAFVIALSGCASTKFTGNTFASETLKKDTYKALSPYAHAKLNCNKIDSINTKVISAVKNGAVKERWVVNGCDRTAPFIVTFTPDPTGVGIAVKSE